MNSKHTAEIREIARRLLDAWLQADHRAMRRAMRKAEVTVLSARPKTGFEAECGDLLMAVVKRTRQSLSEPGAVVSGSSEEITVSRDLLRHLATSLTVH